MCFLLYWRPCGKVNNLKTKDGYDKNESERSLNIIIVADGLPCLFHLLGRYIVP